MAREYVARFDELLRGSKELQAELEVLARTFGGDRADGRAFFDATVGKLAAVPSLIGAIPVLEALLEAR